MPDKKIPDKESLLKIYEQMLRIRLFEQKATELFAQGLVTGSMHLYIGEEAIAATAGELLRKTDTITSTHRGHGHCIAKGGKTDRMMAELLGRSNHSCGPEVPPSSCLFFRPWLCSGHGPCECL